VIVMMMMTSLTSPRRQNPVSSDEPSRDGMNRSE